MNILPGDDFGPVYEVKNREGHTLQISKNFLDRGHHDRFNMGTQHTEGEYYVKFNGKGSNFTQEDLKEFFTAFLLVTKDYEDGE